MAVGSQLCRARTTRRARRWRRSGGRVVARIAGKHPPQQQDNLSGLSGNLLAGRRTSRHPLSRSVGGGGWRRQRLVAARMDRTRSPPKVLEPVGRHVGVSDRVLNVLVPEVMLQGPRVVAIVRELEPA